MAAARSRTHVRLPWRLRRTAIGGLMLATVLTACADSDPQADGEEEGDAWVPGLHDISLAVDEVERTGAVLLPEQWTPDADLPLVVTLHGSQYDGHDQIEWSEVAQSAEAEGYVVLAPDGSIEGDEGGWLWNVPGVTDAPEGTPDEVAFLRDLVQWSTDNLGTSQDDVFATGYSGGGRLISQAACDDPELFSAIAPVTGLRAGVPVEGPDDTWVPDPQTCEPDAATPIITFVGTDDPVNPLDGGGEDYWLYGHEAALERWAQIGGHTDRDETEIEDGVVVTTIGDRDIVSWSVEDAGHVWPGSSVFENETDWAGEPTYAIDATELIWEFFAEQD